MNEPVIESASSPLAAVVAEVEAYAARAGWDRPAQLFALVGTADLMEREPQLAALLGLESEAAEPGQLTPVEQEPVEATLQEVLPTIVWPPEVEGCAVVLEATTTEGDESRIVAGALRGGETWCAVRHRAHDADDLVLSGPDLVPGLLELLHATLEPDPDVQRDPGETSHE